MFSAKIIAKSFLLTSSRLAGRYVPFTSAELSTIRREAISYHGDIPVGWGNERCQWRADYAVPRSAVEISNLTYTERGMAWVEGKLYEKYSLQQPAIKDLVVIHTPLAERSLDAATVVQARNPSTYGDWVTEHLMSIISNLPLRSPLLMPKMLLERPYVSRDLNLLDIEVVRLDCPIFIRKAIVLPYSHLNFSFSPSDVQAFRSAFRITPTQPRSGSILYLSREADSSTKFKRVYPSRMVAEVVEHFGGTVILTGSTSFEEYRNLADSAETVIADHGAAMCNLLFWHTKKVIELFSNAWWNPSFLYLARATGTVDYHLINVDDTNSDVLANKIAVALNIV